MQYVAKRTVRFPLDVTLYFLPDNLSSKCQHTGSLHAEVMVSIIAHLSRLLLNIDLQVSCIILKLIGAQY